MMVCCVGMRWGEGYLGSQETVEALVDLVVAVGGVEWGGGGAGGRG